MTTVTLKGQTLDAGALSANFSYFAFQGSPEQDENKLTNQSVLLDKEEVKEGQIRVYLIFQNCTLSLVELPAESDSGFWRYWVKQENIIL